jgi:hypothetical protein
MLYSRNRGTSKRIIGLGIEQLFSDILRIGPPIIPLSRENRHEKESRLYTKDPTKTISVTALVNDFVPIKYKEGSDKNDGGPKQNLIGKRVHKLLERYLESKMDDTVNIGYPGLSVERNYYYAGKKFNNVMEKNGFVPYRVEMKIIDGNLKVSGEVDAIYVNKETGRKIVVDWKCTEKLLEELGDPYRMYIDILDSREKQNLQRSFFKELGNSTLTQYQLQLSIYSLILRKEYDFEISGMYLVLLRKDVTYFVHKIPEKILDAAIKILEYRKKTIIDLGKTLENYDFNIRLDNDEELEKLGRVLNDEQDEAEVVRELIPETQKSDSEYDGDDGDDTDIAETDEEDNGMFNTGVTENMAESRDKRNLTNYLTPADDELRGQRRKTRSQTQKAQGRKTRSQTREAQRRKTRSQTQTQKQKQTTRKRQRVISNST